MNIEFGHSQRILALSIVMLSEAKHLEAQGERPFAAAQGDMDEVNGVTLCGNSG